MHRTALSIAVAMLLAGCGTSLVVKQTDRGETNPDGIIVNRRTTFSGTATARIPGENASAPHAIGLNGLDHEHVVSLNTSRMPFASSKLVVKLDDRQVPTEISLTTKPGLEGLGKAGAQVATTRKDLTADEEDDE